MPIMSCATRRSRSSTEYPFLPNPIVGVALESISGTPPGEVEDLVSSQMFQIRTKSFKCACMTGIKLNIRREALVFFYETKIWIKDSTFSQIRKAVYPPKKIIF